MRPPPLKHASKCGVIKLRFRKRSRTLTYEQKGGNQSTADCNGVSLDAHIHALYGLTLQRPGKSVLMIGCGGGTLGTMLARADRRVSIVEIDPISLTLARNRLLRNLEPCVSGGDARFSGEPKIVSRFFPFRNASDQLVQSRKQKF